MIDLNVLATGSSGNCFVLNDGNEILLLDAGISIKDIKVGINFEVSKIVGAVVTHCHADHSKAVKDLKNMGVQVFTPYTRKDDAPTVKTRCGKYSISAFSLTDNEGKPTHSNSDGTPCKVYGFYITHEDFEDWNLVYITDTMYCRYTFENIKNMIIGTNYKKEKLEDTNLIQKFHVLTGHCSIDTTKDIIKANNPSNMVMLSHLSLNHADEEEFLSEAKTVAKCDVYVATAGLKINL